MYNHDSKNHHNCEYNLRLQNLDIVKIENY